MYRELSFDSDNYSLDESELDDYSGEEMEASDLTFEVDGYSISDPDFSGLSFDDYSSDEPDILLDVPYVPTAEKVVNAMLDLAGVGAKDVLYDLGCGDGRIVVTAALNRGTRGIGVDMDPTRIAEAMELAGNVGVEFLVDFFEADLLEVNFSKATVVTLYLLDSINVELRPRLLSELRPGTRIVSHAFKMGDWKPDRSLRMGNVDLHKWVVPANVASSKTWKTVTGETYLVELHQKYQQLTGNAWVDGKPAILTSALLQGEMLELVVQKDENSRPERRLIRCQNDGSSEIIDET